MNQMFYREAERQETLVKLSNAPQELRNKLIEEYKKRSEKAYASETLRNYKQINRGFDEWCAERNYSSSPPVSPSVVAEYVDWLGGRIRHTTIGTRLWAIGEKHRAHFQVSPCRHRLVELALIAVKRKYGTAIRQACPLGKKEVLQAIDNLGNSRLDQRDAALLWIATDSWCRSSEIVGFRVRDLLRQEDGSSLLFISKSKTDQYGQGAYAFLSEKGTLAVLRWIETAQLKFNDPIITKSQRGARVQSFNPSSVSRVLKKRFDRKDVSAHSTRVGGVQDAFRIGCDVASIMVAGRWTSPAMPAQYGRKILASQSAAAQVSKAFELPTSES
ncbi:recombinase XerD [Rhodobacteraceae bacterium]|nr:recombinase XerD [Paracoccaceae bacterium]